MTETKKEMTDDHQSTNPLIHQSINPRTVMTPTDNQNLNPQTDAQSPALNLQRSTFNLQQSPPQLLAEHDPSATISEIKNRKSKIENALVPITQAVETIDAQPLSPISPNAKRKTRRHGRVASLPKIQRDMVNRMLWNGVPYKNIVTALDDAGYTLIERNISNWATGGYLEWRLEQEAVLDNRLNQDHLLDFLRRDDAPELPEVGLQAAATRLSQVLLQKLAHADDPEANLANYTKMIDLLCRLNREISATQKQRDDSRRTLGPQHNPVKDVEQVEAIETERFYSDPPSDSDLQKPAVPPLLPDIPTATILAEQAREEKQAAEIARIKRSRAMLQKLMQKTPPAASTPPAS